MTPCEGLTSPPSSPLPNSCGTQTSCGSACTPCQDCSGLKARLAASERHRKSLLNCNRRLAEDVERLRQILINSWGYVPE